VPGQRPHDLLPRGLLSASLTAPAVMKGNRLDHEPGRAVAALERVTGDKRSLHRMQIGPKAFHGRDRTALERRRREQAARDRDAVHQNRARPADSLAADQLGPRQTEAITQDLNRGLLNTHIHLARRAVNADVDPLDQSLAPLTAIARRAAAVCLQTRRCGDGESLTRAAGAGRVRDCRSPSCERCRAGRDRPQWCPANGLGLAPPRPTLHRHLLRPAARRARARPPALA
jgi:hypothetical protein